MKTIQNKIRINDMKTLLINNYECIGKLDAMKFLRKFYPNADLKMFIEAYELAY